MALAERAGLEAAVAQVLAEIVLARALPRWRFGGLGFRVKGVGFRGVRVWELGVK